MVNVLLKVATFRQLDIMDDKYDINVLYLGHIGLSKWMYFILSSLKCMKSVWLLDGL